MKHAKPRKTNWPVVMVTIISVIALVALFIFMCYEVFDFHNSGKIEYHEKPYFTVEPWTIGVELATGGPTPTYPKYFTYNTEETETDG